MERLTVRKKILVLTTFTLITATLAFSQEEITLTTIMPDGERLRRGVVGHHDVNGNGVFTDPGDWDFRTVQLTNDDLYVGRRLGVGTSAPQNILDVEGGAAIGAAYSGTNAAPANGLIVEGAAYIGTSASLTGGTEMLQLAGGFYGQHGRPLDLTSYRISFSNGAFRVYRLVAPLYNTEYYGIFANTKGNVGVGEGSPANRLSVGGNAAIGSGYSGTNTAPANGLIVQGNVGIAMTTPQYPLDVNGNVRLILNGLSFGSNTVYATAAGLLTRLAPLCDVRVKTNIKNISDDINVLSALNELNGIYFNWNTELEEIKDYGDKRQVGLIAQDVEKVLPEAVQTGDRGYKSIEYHKLIPFLVEVCKAQQKEIESLEARVKKLEGGL